MHNHSQHTASLGLSLMPAFFAAGCCATAPLIVMFGFSVGETALYDYRYYFRLGGIVVFVLSLAWYFYKQGITNRTMYLEHKNMIAIITLQTALYSVAIYSFLLVVVAPVMWEQVLEQSGSCCGL